ncbi:MAG: glycosyltransferase family 2 protein [Paludibacter sp.]
MINVSIVLYRNTYLEIASLVEVLNNSTLVSEVFIIDNSPTENQNFKNIKANYIFNNKNIGYGAAHNIAIQKTIDQNKPYHLVMNPDIAFQTYILSEIESFMNNNSDIGLLMPKIIYPSGEIQYLCKLIPTPFDLIFRRFLPKSWTLKQTEKFELRESGYDHEIDVPYLSGCFMFLRIEAIKKVGMFDERFFMYPEDIDLSRRIHRKYRTVFYPEVQAVHYHTKASYSSNKMLFIHIVNLIRYFNKWGWIFDSERRKVNNKTLNQFK